MSHSKIFQIGSKPVKEEDYESPEEFYENSHDFADYIGYEMTGDDRRECIEYLAERLSDLFTLDKKRYALVYKGEEALQKFKEEWAAAIRKAALEITPDNLLESSPRWQMRSICRETHLMSSYRVSIEEWNGCAGPLGDLIEWVAYSKFKAGKKLYVGAVIDYHY